VEDADHNSVHDSVADAIRYYRYRGASLQSIDSYAKTRANAPDYATLRAAAMGDLEREGHIEKRGKLWYLQPSAFKEARGNSYAPEFEEMDFCVLLAIVGVGDDCELSNLIGTFDFIVRTLPAYDEIYGGLNRLHAAKLIVQKRGRFSPSEKAKALFATAKSNAKRSMYDQLEALKRLVLCPCCGVPLKRVSWRIQITESEFGAELAKYTGKAKSHRNRVAGGSCPPRPPHHLACGSALGGSSKRSKLHPTLL